MDITFTCPHCGEVTLIGEEFVGQSGECRACGAKVTVPPLQASASTSSDRVSSSPSLGSYIAYGILTVIVLGIPGMCLLPLDTPRGASRRMQSGNHLKQIALAMHNYHEEYGHLPRAYWVTEDGERRYSWRVALLPFIEEQDLADRYRPLEAWNSGGNLELSKERVKVYEQPGKTEMNTETCYMVITGPGTLFEEGKDISFADCTDGLANTILAVEVKDSGVNWAQPVDLDIRNMIFQINRGGLGIGSPWKGGAQVAMADGSVRFLDDKTLESTLRAMITRAGGETVSIPR